MHTRQRYFHHVSPPLLELPVLEPLLPELLVLLLELVLDPPLLEPLLLPPLRDRLPELDPPLELLVEGGGVFVTTGIPSSTGAG